MRFTKNQIDKNCFHTHKLPLKIITYGAKLHHLLVYSVINVMTSLMSQNKRRHLDVTFTPPLHVLLHYIQWVLKVFNMLFLTYHCLF